MIDPLSRGAEEELPALDPHEEVHVVEVSIADEETDDTLTVGMVRATRTECVPAQGQTSLPAMYANTVMPRPNTRWCNSAPFVSLYVREV